MDEQLKRKVLVGGLAVLIVGAGSVWYITRDGDPRQQEVTENIRHGRKPRPPKDNPRSVRPPRPTVNHDAGGSRVRPPRPPHRPDVTRDRPGRGGHTVRPNPHHKPMKPAA